MRPTLRRCALSLVVAAAASCAGAPPQPAPPTVTLAPAAAPAPTAEPVAPEPPAPTATASARAPSPQGTARRVDPEEMKQYRIDCCYTGGLALRQGRDDYLSTLGKRKPGPGRIPAFVDLDPHQPVPFDREARECSIAGTLKGPDFGDVDAALASYTIVAVQMAHDLIAARDYYRKDEHKADGFARGRELHDALAPGFAQLDALHDKLGAALAARRNARPVSAAGEGERLARAAIDDAREVLLLGVAPKLDGAAFASATAKLGHSIDDIDAWQAADEADIWLRIMRTPLDQLRRVAAEPYPPGARRLPSLTVHRLVRAFVGVLLGRMRSVSRSTM